MLITPPPICPTSNLLFPLISAFSRLSLAWIRRSIDVTKNRKGATFNLAIIPAPITVFPLPVAA